MRSTRSFWLLWALCLLLVGSILVPPATSSADESAGVRLARLTPAEGDSLREAPAPRVLGRSDLTRYREIFALQERARWSEADRVIRQLDDPVLMGHVMAQRYLHPTGYRSRYDELARWLERYADHPQASRIHRLALRRQPRGAAPPLEPVPGYLGGAGQEIAFEAPAPAPSRARGPRDAEAARQIQVRFDLRLARGELDGALADLRHPSIARVLDRLEQDRLRWEVAASLAAAGRVAEAHRLAAAAAQRSGRDEPRLHWTAGIAAWRLGRHEEAGRHFMALANAEGVAGTETARAAFWAARAHLVNGRPQLVGRFLRQAARQPHDFYGLIAAAMLGETPSFDWEHEELKGSVLEVLLGVDGARRAMALGELGRLEDAEREIRKLAARARPRLVAGLIALADSLDLPAAQMRLAVRLSLDDGRRHDAAFFPLPRWRPDGGFELDRALVYAFMRAESGFDPEAESPAGAHGLMQLMPATAREVAERLDIALPGSRALFEPQTNLALGEGYLRRLLATDTVAGDLIHLAAAYNAGLTRLARWKQTQGAGDDPLLFVESLPIPETRAYVKKVLANLWVYRIRLGQEPPSLQAIAANAWPAYVALEERSLADARDRPDAPVPALKDRRSHGLRYADAL